MELLNGTMHFCSDMGSIYIKWMLQTLSFDKTITYKFADKIS